MSIFKRSNIPNILSVFRICLVPAFVYLFHVAKMYGVALTVFLLAGVTDVVDGVLARRFNWISNVGKVLDPFADKCMQIAALICMGLGGFVSYWIVAILSLKEFVLFAGAVCALQKKKVYVQSSWYGKAGTIAFYIVTTLLILVKDMPDSIRLLLGMLLILFMLFALLMYIHNYRKNIMHSDAVSERSK